MPIPNILSDVLKKIKPATAAMPEEINNFMEDLNKALAKSKLNAKAVVGGSIAKNTYLKGDHDCDIFVRFNNQYKDEEISGLLAKALQRFKAEKVHGSRDYFHIKNKINFEIVPVLDIKDPKDAVNVTDMSPLHVDWVNKKVKEQKGITDDIRLAKQFCKAAKVYGAESYIKGFSGHVLDILVIHYKGFQNLLEASKDWKEKEIIDPENHYKKSKKDALKDLNRSKIDSPIIIIDPVFPERNAAAALSEEKLRRFQEAAKKFLENPVKTAFTIKEKTIAQLKKDAGKNKLIILDARPIKNKEDVAGAKLMKAFQQIGNQLKFNDFIIKDADWSWDKADDARLWFIVDPKELLPVTKRLGPPLKEKERCESFKEKHKKTFTENERLCAYVNRKYTKTGQLMKDLLKDPLLKEKVKSIKIHKV